MMQVEPVKDPSWDAHKVYFNERESNDPKKNKKTKGDEFDEFFDSTKKQLVDRALEKMMQQQQQQQQQQQGSGDDDNDALDPLGWPLQQAGFETTSVPLPTTGTAAAVLSLHGYVDPAASFESDDGDDLNLIPYRPSDYYPEDDDNKNSTNDNDDDALGEEAGIEVMCHGVNDALVLTPAPLASKERRIQMYESRGVDEDSSVEEEENTKEEEDWEEGRQVEYDSMKPSQTEDDDERKEPDQNDDNDDSSNDIMNIDKNDYKNKAKYQNIPSFDQSDRNSGDAGQQPASFQAAADAANLAALPSPSSPTAAKKGFLKGLMGAGKKNKNMISPKSKDKRNKKDAAAPPPVVAPAAANNNNNNKPIIPLLRPPPVDKLKQWEESQERAKKHLEK
jgi:hypothetical protein